MAGRGTCLFGEQPSGSRPKTDSRQGEASSFLKGERGTGFTIGMQSASNNQGLSRAPSLWSLLPVIHWYIASIILLEVFKPCQYWCLASISVVMLYRRIVSHWAL